VTAFDPQVRRSLHEARTVRIETSAGPGRPLHEAIIWVVIDDADRVLVRSWRGERGRWYRELTVNPTGRLRVADRWIPICAEPARDRDRVEGCSRALQQKYATARGSLAEMLADDVLPTTLELHPA
jgi:hypothetical protein